MGAMLLYKTEGLLLANAYGSCLGRLGCPFREDVPGHAGRNNTYERIQHRWHHVTEDSPLVRRKSVRTALTRRQKSPFRLLLSQRREQKAASKPKRQRS